MFHLYPFCFTPLSHSFLFLMFNVGLYPKSYQITSDHSTCVIESGKSLPLNNGVTISKLVFPSTPFFKCNVQAHRARSKGEKHKTLCRYDQLSKRATCLYLISTSEEKGHKYQKKHYLLALMGEMSNME